MESLQRFQAYMSSNKPVTDDYFFDGHLSDGVFFVEDDDAPTPNTQKQAYESDEKENWIEGEIDEMSHANLFPRSCCTGEKNPRHESDDKQIPVQEKEERWYHTSLEG